MPTHRNPDSPPGCGAKVKRDRLKVLRAIEGLIKFNGSLSNVQIAEALGISRQLVHYHSRNIHLPRQGRSHVACIGCGLRVRHRNRTAMCRSCWLKSYAYEFRCAFCGEINVVYGLSATARRIKIEKDPSRKQFCNSQHLGKYHRKKIEPKEEQDDNTNTDT